LRQCRRNKDQDGRFAVLEKAAGGLAHKTGGEHERHREQTEVGEPAEGREAVDPRQNDEKERQRSGQSPAKETGGTARHYPGGRTAMLKTKPGQGGCPDQQGLLDD